VITGLQSDVILYTHSTPVDGADAIEQKIKEVVPEARAIGRSFNSLLMAGGPNGVVGAVLEGFEPETFGLVTDVPKRVIEGVLPQANGEFAIGASLALKLGAKVGSTIRLIAPFGADKETKGAASTDSSEAKYMDGKVVGIVKVGMYQYDSKFVFAPIQTVQEFYGQPGRVTSFKIRLKDLSQSRAVAKRLGEAIGYPFRAKDWSMLNQNLFVAIELEKVVIALLLTAIILVAAFNMLSTLMMLMHDKTREISILKAMGFSRTRMFKLFVLIGLGIGGVGVIGGTLLGLGANTILDHTQFVKLPNDIYYIDYLPVTYRWAEIGTIGAFAIIICLVAAVLPAIQVARRSAIEGIRND